VGDVVYGVKDARLTRQALHAWRLGCDHPRTKEHLVLTAPIPTDLNALLRSAFPLSVLSS
jgi:23S rRNA pseudouridine1911/1915/1917 synthase